MIEKDTHIALLYHEGTPAALLDEFCADVNSDSLKFRRMVRPQPGPQAGMEWLALPAIAVFLLESYFKGFMAEAGKDHYLLLRKALKGLWGKLISRDRGFRVIMITASGEKKLKYSMLFAIYATGNNDQSTKLLIREDCSEDEFVASIDAFLNFLESHHSGIVEQQKKIDLNFENSAAGITLVEYDGARKCLRVVDPRLRARACENDDS